MTPPRIAAARLLGIFEPGTAEWDAARSGRVVTATEVAAIVGLSPWVSPFSLWHHKAGTVQANSASNAAMSWGSRLEPVIADAFAEAHTDLVVHATGTWENERRPWQRATPDRILIPADGGAASLLEVKTSRYGDGFGEPGTDGVPVYYRCQVLWQLDTLGLEAAHVAVLIAGQDYREYVVRYDEGEAAFLREQAAGFLASVEAGTPPPLDGHTATYRTAQRLPGGVEEVVVEISPAIAEAYRAALLDHRRAEEAKREASAAVLAAMVPAKKCQADGRLVATRTVRGDGTTRSLIPHPTYVKAATA